MKLSKPKNFNKKLSAKLLSMLMLILAVNSCSLFSKKEPILTSDFPAKYYELPEDEEVVNWVANAPLKGYEYVKINEATNACERKKTKELREKCYQKFLDFDNGNK